MGLSDSALLNVQKILNLDDKQIEDVKEKSKSLDEFVIETINRLPKLHGKDLAKDLAKDILAHGNCTNLLVFVTKDGINSYSNEEVQYAFLISLFKRGYNPKYFRLYNDMIQWFPILSQIYWFHIIIDENDNRQFSIVRTESDKTRDVHTFEIGKEVNTEIKDKIMQNESKINKVLNLYGCDLRNFVVDEMNESSLIYHVCAFSDIKTVLIMLGYRGLNLEHGIKELYLLWLLDNSIDRTNKQVIRISSQFEQGYKESLLLIDNIKNNDIFPDYLSKRSKQIAFLTNYIKFYGQNIWKQN